MLTAFQYFQYFAFKYFISLSRWPKWDRVLTLIQASEHNQKSKKRYNVWWSCNYTHIRWHKKSNNTGVTFRFAHLHFIVLYGSHSVSLAVFLCIEVCHNVRVIYCGACIRIIIQVFSVCFNRWKSILPFCIIFVKQIHVLHWIHIIKIKMTYELAQWS